METDGDLHSRRRSFRKAYDSRLMKRLLAYLRPYKWQVALALGPSC